LLRLLAATLIQVALGAALCQRKTRRVAHAGFGLRMAHEQHTSTGAQARSKVIGGKSPAGRDGCRTQPSLQMPSAVHAALVL
jgi:hypothetical protein